jgi:hypothetical protein
LSVFAKQFWFELLKIGGLQNLCPQQDVLSFEAWWRHSSSAVTGYATKKINSYVILGALIIWKHRNRCVFEGCIDCVLQAAREEVGFWSISGGKAFRFVQIEELLP